VTRGGAAWIALVGAASVLGLPRVARGDQVDSRYGFAPVVGTGFAVVSHAAPLPSFVGLTALGGEFLGEVPPWGGFLRAEFVSSGDGGRWTELSFALGGSRRLVGAAGRVSLLARAGVAYQHWMGSSGGCGVLLFVPNSCMSQGPPPMMGLIMAVTPVTSYSGDVLGILGGVRLELPVGPLYFAVDTSATPGLDVGSSSPGALIGFRLDLLVGFRDRRSTDETPEPQQTGPRFRRGT